jgi:hypothetical protein
MNKNKSLLMAISALLIGSSVLSACSANNPNTIAKNNPVITNKVTSKNQVIDIGKGQKGATISFKLNLKDKNSFKTKDTTTESGQSNEIDHFVVYLIENSEAVAGEYPSDGNPIGDAVAGYESGFTMGKDIDEVTFSNVPASSLGAAEDYYYFVAVRAVAANGEDIIKVNNDGQGTWTGTETTDPPINARVAVSTGKGVKVDDGYKIVDGPASGIYDNLPVQINIDDAIGAKIGTNININDGDSTLTFDVNPK